VDILRVLSLTLCDARAALLEDLYSDIGMSSFFLTFLCVFSFCPRSLLTCAMHVQRCSRTCTATSVCLEFS